MEKTEIGYVSIVENKGKIIYLFFSNELENKTFIIEKTPILEEAFLQLNQYLKAERKSFNLPLFYNKSSFQNSVLDELQNINYGKTASYKDIAIKINNPKASRAVGNANNKNPIPIFIPCHRIIGSNGSLTGYAGGLKMKSFLINLEKQNI